MLPLCQKHEDIIGGNWRLFVYSGAVDGWTIFEVHIFLLSRTETIQEAELTEALIKSACDNNEQKNKSVVFSYFIKKYANNIIIENVSHFFKRILFEGIVGYEMMVFCFMDFI
jgi:hypothetical protein